MAKRILLIDADVVAYQCASALEEAVEWECGHWTWNVNFNQVTDRCDRVIEQYMDELDGDEAVLCLTDPVSNFRIGVLPTYKTHRKTVRKPLVLMGVKDWMVEERDAILRPGLEGDDVMGILATRPNKKREERIIVSIDKDMKTIPGNYVRTRLTVDKEGTEVSGAFDIQEITEKVADQYHMMQTLSGDATDGYKGCPGVGVDTAEKIILNRTKLEAYEHTLLRGPNKGEVQMRTRGVECDDLWEIVMSYYENAGLTEEDALAEARVARILRASDYNFKTKEPILWTP